MASSTAINIKSLDKNFGAKKALSNVSFSVKEGGVFGFLGPNGAGKTTTIRCIMDYIRPSSGTIHVLGKDSVEKGPEIKRSVGYMSADEQMYGHWTGKKHLDFLLAEHGLTNKVQELIDRLDLDMNTKVKNLSSGNKQKLAIVLAFANQPKLLIMDEPTRGLDPMLQIELYKIIDEHKKAGGTIFLSSHNLPEVQKVCDRIAVIKQGKLIEITSIKNLLRLQTHIIHAVTSKPINAEKIQAKNVEIMNHEKNDIHLKVRGELAKTLDVIRGYGIKDIEINHANLEDVFMELYQ